MLCGSFRERRRLNILSVSLHLKDLITIEIIYRNALNVKRYTGRSTFVGIVFLLALRSAEASAEFMHWVVLLDSEQLVRLSLTDPRNANP